MKTKLKKWLFYFASITTIFSFASLSISCKKAESTEKQNDIVNPNLNDKDSPNKNKENPSENPKDKKDDVNKVEPPKNTEEPVKKTTEMVTTVLPLYLKDEMWSLYSTKKVGFENWDFTIYKGVKNGNSIFDLESNVLQAKKINEIYLKFAQKNENGQINEQSNTVTVKGTKVDNKYTFIVERENQDIIYELLEPYELKLVSEEFK
ncbi:hypothetical protein [Mesomycoplasma lagogenitalium]|uniref:Lipoprotein n=1 Tax=Mesomycoplasma lagogenitalium TaxID=171286 RepID=A0ABY8LUE1_9BACT|nr:hypothetical protein [Mesomycoplasma lagogenitalium]WGI36865.1 hypothetical protein QEG99_01100 [Mesomycoplasma lagogenitalium]